MRKRETSKSNTPLAGALRAAVAVVVLAPALGWAGTGPLWRLAFEGERPLEIQGAGAALANPDDLAGRLSAAGLVLETGAAGPLIETTAWDSDAGTLTFWLQPVGWTADSNFTFVRFSAEGAAAAASPPGGGFTLQANRGNLRCVTGEGDWGTGNRGAIGHGPLLDGNPETWRHVAVAWQKEGLFHLYVDGQPVYKLDQVFRWPNPFNVIRLGPPNAGIRMDRTLIRDMRLYPRPLMESEVALLAGLASGGALPAATAGGQAEAAEREIVPVGLTVTPPVMDGTLGGDEYATLLQGLLDCDLHHLYPQASQVGLAADDEYLYVGATVELPAGFTPRAVATARDEPAQLHADAFHLFIRRDTDLDSQALAGAYIVVGPNSTIYDCHQTVNWSGGTNVRDTDVDYALATASTVADGRWTVELRAPLAELGLVPGEPFALSLGFHFNTAEGRRRLALRTHPAWFDHPQAFVEARFTALGAGVALGGPGRGRLAPSFTLRNAGREPLAGRAAYLLGTPDIRETARDWVYDETIGEEVSVRIAGALRAWHREFALAAGAESALGDAQRLEEPGAYLLRLELAAANGETLLRRTIPFVFFHPVNVELAPVHSKQQIKATASFHGVDLAQVAELGFAYRGADGAPVASRFPVTASREVFQISMAEMAPGRHAVEVSLFNPAGEVIAARTVPFEKWADPEWLTNRVALEALEPDWVPHPWRPVVVDGLAADVWGRHFRFAPESMLPLITSQGLPLDAGPTTLAYEIGGQRHAVAVRRTELAESQRGRAVFRRSGGSEHFDYRAEHQIEFDGLETVTLTLTPKSNLAVDNMVLDIPLADIRHYSAGLHRGRIEGRRAFDRIDHIWLAGDEIGMVWSAENYRGWQIDSRRPRVVLEQDGDVTRLRLLLVNTAATVSAPMEIRFFRHPTPLKPMPEGYRDWRFSPGWSPHLNLWSQHHAAWNSALAKPTPRTWDVLRDSVAFAREYGQRTYPFNIPLWMSHYHMTREEAPFIRPDLSREERLARAVGQEWGLQERDDSRRVEEAIYFFEDWNIVPPLRSGRTDVGTIYYCSPSSSYADYWAHSLEQLLIQGGIDGIYMDLANVRRPCLDPEKGHAYTTLDGETEGTMELVAARNFYKRLYYILLQHRGPEGAPHMLGHGSLVPSLYTSFWGLAFMGELFKPGDWFDMTQWYLQQELFAPRMLASPEPDAPRSYDAFVYRALYPQAQFGIPTMILPQYSKGSADPPTQRRMNQDPALAREMLAFTFLHDHILWPSRVHVYTVYTFWEQTRMAEWAHATFHPYWRNGLAPAPEGVRASYWRREDGAHLLAVANWSGAAVTAELALPATAVGADEVLDVERGETLPVVAGRLTAEIPPHDLRVFRMGGTE